MVKGALMYVVSVKNPCRCFIKEKLKEYQEFNTLQEAKNEAERMLTFMEDNFCHAHSFKIQERGDKNGYEIVIS